MASKLTLLSILLLAAFIAVIVAQRPASNHVSAAADAFCMNEDVTTISPWYHTESYVTWTAITVRYKRRRWWFWRRRRCGTYTVWSANYHTVSVLDVKLQGSAKWDNDALKDFSLGDESPNAGRISLTTLDWSRVAPARALQRGEDHPAHMQRYLQATPNPQVGSAFFYKPIDVRNGFIVTWWFAIGPMSCRRTEYIDPSEISQHTCESKSWDTKYSVWKCIKPGYKQYIWGEDIGICGGEGMALLIQPNGPTYIGEGGSGLGYKGIPNVLALEFDTRTSPETNDPSNGKNRHISLIVRKGPASASEVDAIAWNDNPINFNNPGGSDPFFSNFKIEFAYLNGFFRLFVEDIPILKASAAFDFQAYFGTHLFYFGFSGSQGATGQFQNATLFNIQIPNINYERSGMSLIVPADKRATDAYRQYVMVGKVFHLGVHIRDWCYVARKLDGGAINQVTPAWGATTWPGDCTFHRHYWNTGFTDVSNAHFVFDVSCKWWGNHWFFARFNNIQLGHYVYVLVFPGPLDRLTLSFVKTRNGLGWGTVDYPCQWDLFGYDYIDNYLANVGWEHIKLSEVQAPNVNVVWPTSNPEANALNIFRKHENIFQADFYSLRAGRYKVVSKYFKRGPTEYWFDITPGNPWHTHSIIYIGNNWYNANLPSEKVVAGQPLWMHVDYADRAANRLDAYYEDRSNTQLLIDAHGTIWVQGYKQLLANPTAYWNLADWKNGISYRYMASLLFYVYRAGKLTLTPLIWGYEAKNCFWCKKLVVIPAAPYFPYTEVWPYDITTKTYYRHPDITPQVQLYRQWGLQFWLRMRDVYWNYIDDFNPKQYKVVLLGNYMVPMTLCATSNTQYEGSVYAPCNAVDARIFSRLVFRESYSIALYQVTTSGENYVKGWWATVARRPDDYENDLDAGNGPMVPQHTTWSIWWPPRFTPESWIVGRNYWFLITLRTAQWLRFNDYVEDKRITIVSNLPDASDSYTVERFKDGPWQKYGQYRVTFYTTKSYAHLGWWRRFNVKIDGTTYSNAIDQFIYPEWPHYGRVHQKSIATTNTTGQYLSPFSTDDNLDVTYEMFDYWHNPTQAAPHRYHDLRFVHKWNNEVQSLTPLEHQVYLVGYNVYRIVTLIPRATVFNFTSAYFQNNLRRNSQSAGYGFTIYAGTVAAAQSSSWLDLTGVPYQGLEASKSTSFLVLLRDRFWNPIPNSRHFTSPADKTLDTYILQPASRSPGYLTLGWRNLKSNERVVKANDVWTHFYAPEVQRVGVNTFYAYAKGQQIPCALCFITVTYTDMRFDNSDIYRLRGTSEFYIYRETDLPTSPQNVIFNKQERPIFVIYQLDKFFNVLPFIEPGWQGYKARVLNKENQILSDFIAQPHKNGIKFLLDDTYSTPGHANYQNWETIAYGVYNLVFYGTKVFANGTSVEFSLAHKVLIQGDGAAADASYSSNAISQKNSYLSTKKIKVIAGSWSDQVEVSLRTTDCDEKGHCKLRKFIFRDPNYNAIKLVKANTTNWNVSDDQCAAQIKSNVENGKRFGTASLAFMNKKIGTWFYDVYAYPNVTNQTVQSYTEFYLLIGTIEVKIVAGPPRYIVPEEISTTFNRVQIKHTTIDFGINFQFKAYDQYENIVEEAEFAKFQFGLAGQSKQSRNLKQPSLRFIATNQTWLYSVPIEKSNNYTITAVGIKEYANETVEFSKFIHVMVYPGKPFPPNCIGTFNRTDMSAGEAVDFMVTLKDRYDNIFEDLDTENPFFDLKTEMTKFQLFIKYPNSTDQLGERYFRDANPSENRDYVRFNDLTIFRAGELKFTAQYEGQAVQTQPGIFRVYPGAPDPTKTNIGALDWKLLDQSLERWVQFFNGVEFSYSTQYSPKLKAIYNDRYMNDYGRIPSNFINQSMTIKQKVANGQMGGERIALCANAGDKTIYEPCTVDPDDANRDPPSWRWKFLSDKDLYEVQLIQWDTAANKGTNINAPIDIVSLYNDSSASSLPLEVQHTVIEQVKIEAFAGKTAAFDIELRTIDKTKRRNYWYRGYTNASLVRVEPLIADSTFKFETQLGKQPGQYRFVISSNVAYSASRPQTIRVFIENTLVATQNVTFIVHPFCVEDNKYKIDLVQNIQIRNTTFTHIALALPLANSDTDEDYTILFQVRDKFSNPCYITQQDFKEQTSIQVVDPKGVNVAYTATLLSSKLVQIKFNPIVRDLHRITINNNLYIINIAPGAPHKTTTVGSIRNFTPVLETGSIVSFAVAVRDGENNVVDCTPQLITQIDAEFKNGQFWRSIPANATCDASNQELVYTWTIYEKGTYQLTSQIYDADTTCRFCSVTVKPLTPDFSKFELYYLDERGSQYGTFNQSEVLKEHRGNSHPVYRILAKDVFGNSLDEIKLSTIASWTATIVDAVGDNTTVISQPIALTLTYIENSGWIHVNLTSTQVESIWMNDTAMGNGAAKIEFNNGSLTRTWNIKVINGNEETDSDVGIIDLNKTKIVQRSDNQISHLTEFNYTVKAGDILEIELEFRSVNDLRKKDAYTNKSTLHAILSHDSVKHQINYISTNRSDVKGRFVASFNITRTINDSNVLKITFKNDTTLLPIQINVIVVPAGLHHTNLSNLVNQTIDQQPYTFIVTGWDRFDNIQPVSTKFINLKVNRRFARDGSEETKDTSSTETDQTDETETTFEELKNGQIRVVSKFKEVGKYQLESNQFDKNYFIWILAGRPDPKKCEFEVITQSPVTVGKLVQGYLTIRDVNGNLIKPINADVTKFFVRFKHSEISEYVKISAPTTGDEYPNSFRFSSNVTVAGTINFEVYFNNPEEESEDNENVITIDKCTNCRVTFQHDDAWLPYSSFIVVKGDKEVPAVNYTIDGDTNQTVVNLTIKFFDKFRNPIVRFYQDFNFNAIMNGNNMEQIDLNTEIVNNNSLSIAVAAKDIVYFNTLVPEQNYTIKIQRLLAGQMSGEADIKFHIDGKNPLGYGNGDIDISKTAIDTNYLITRAGEARRTLIHLRTTQSKLFGGVIPQNVLTVVASNADCKFTIVQDILIKSRFILTVNGTKSTPVNKDCEYKLNVNDSKRIELANDLLKLTILANVPDSSRTEINVNLPVKIKTQEVAQVTFRLRDRFGNLVASRSQANSIAQRIEPFALNGTASFGAVGFTNGDNDDDLLFTINVQIRFPPTEFIMNANYKETDKLAGTSVVTLFQKNLTTIVMADLALKNTLVSGELAYTFTADQQFGFDLLLRDDEYYCFEGPLSVQVEVDGPYLSSNKLNNDLATSSKTIVQQSQITMTEVRQVAAECKRFFKVLIADSAIKKVGYYQITVTAKNLETGVSDTSIIRQTLMTYGKVDASQTVVIDGEGEGTIDVNAGENTQFTLFLRDRFENAFNKPQHDEKVNITIPSIPDSNYTNTTANIPYGKTVVTLNITKRELYGNAKRQIILIINGVTVDYNSLVIIGAPSQFNVIPGKCANRYTDQPELASKINDTELQTAKVLYFIFKCKDIFNNTCEKSDGRFSANIIYSPGQDSTHNVRNTITSPLNDGNYSLSFTLANPGMYSVQLNLESTVYTQQWNFNAIGVCPIEKAYLCPKKATTDANVCQASFIDCLDASERCATDPKQYKCADNSCANNWSDCPAPANHVKCADGRIVTKKESCQEIEGTFCPHGYAPCTNKFSCRINGQDCPTRKVCPPLYYLAADYTCVKNVEDLAAKQATSTSSKSVVCPDQSIRAFYDDCPTQPTCDALTTSRVLCVTDANCYSSDALCKIVQCSDLELPYQCADGSCAKDQSGCPSKPVCKPSQALCSNNMCADKCMTSSPTAASKRRLAQLLNTTDVKCPTGEIRQNIYQCPSKPVCEVNTIQCPDGSCARDVSECSSTKCQANEVLCWDNRCETEIEKCSTRSTCSLEKNIQCPDGRCVLNINECNNTFVACPREVPYKCATGECRSSQNECPTLTICPSSQPILCNDGSCKKAPYLCHNIAASKNCASNKFLCPDGSCSFSKQLCPQISTCAEGQIRCSDGRCASFHDECNIVTESVANCPTSLAFKCPDGSCRALFSDCPTQIICPQEKSIRCDDGTCAQSVTQCHSQTECGFGLTKCPDGTCTASTAACSNTVTCPVATPYKCYDQTCRIDTLDCPQPLICGVDRPILCPDGNCVGNRVECLPLKPECPHERPVRCPDFNCYASSTECEAISGCPLGFFQCNTGECVRRQEQCRNQKCPLHLPEKCWDGFCVSDLKLCSNSTSGCSNKKPFKCSNGECTNDLDKCPKNVECTGDANKLCPDGSCTENVCPNIYGCPNVDEVRCANGQCRKRSSGCPVAECPASAPIKCQDGLCVESLSACPVQLTLVQFQTCQSDIEGNNIPCADGSCVSSSDQCKPIFACPNSGFRCANGECRKSKELCPLAPNSCPLNRPFRCDSGACSTSYESCPLSNGCPQESRVKCTGTGACVKAETECSTLLNQFGCEYSSPIKCGTDENNKTICVKKQHECTDLISSKKCNETSDKPFLCVDGSCVASSQVCLKQIYDCKGKYICPDMTCRTNYSECDTIGKCDIDTPYKCSDGTCKRLPFSVEGVDGCVAATKCPDYKPYLCANGQCIGDPSLCKTLPPCPADLPHRCADKRCVSSSTACGKFNFCPSASPVLCDGGFCVESVTECLSTKDAICPLEKPFRCVKGNCASSPEECFNVHFVEASSGRLLQQSSISVKGESKDLCNKDFSIRCFDGSCRKQLSDCPIFEGCADPKAPYMCPTGVCSTSRNQCPSTIKSCDNGLKRCSDNICRATCENVPVNVCPPESPLLCTNGLCVESLAKCAGASDCKVETPFRCVDSLCVSDFTQCKRPSRTFLSETFVATINPSQTSTIEFINDPTNLVKYGKITVPASALLPPMYSPNAKKAITTTAIKITPVAYSQVQNLSNPINSTHKELLDNFFPLNGGKLKSYQTIRSSIIRVETLNRIDAREFYRFPIVISLKTDIINSPLFSAQNHLCLATPDNKTNEWRCVSKKIAEYEQVNHIVSFEVQQDGIYAVIFNPKWNGWMNQIENCGFICKNRGTIISLVMIGLPILLIISYVFWRMTRYVTKYRKQKKEMKNIENEINDLMKQKAENPFATIQDNKEGIIFTSNPLSNHKEEDLTEIKALNQIIEKLSVDRNNLDKNRRNLLEIQKRYSKEIGTLRQELEKYQHEKKYELEQVEVRREEFE